MLSPACKEIPTGIYSLDNLKELGEEKGWCPYFMTRRLLHYANIIVYNYQYMLDPKVANLVRTQTILLDMHTLSV